MTGPEHYQEAERLIRYANGIPDGFPSEEFAQSVLQAQVHATLAMAAATAVMCSDGLPTSDWNAWRDLAATKDEVTR